jgi:hypothetical protein
MIRTLICAAALAAAAMPALGFAQAVEEKNLLSGKESIEPGSGYIYVSGPIRQAGVLLRAPDAESIADYEREWAEELAKVQKKYPGKVRQWELGVEMAKRQRRKPPEAPIEPTPENFSIGPIELRGAIFFGPQFVFAKSKEPESYSYLIKARPGRYAYYGPIMLAAQGNIAGVCFCMGTVAFEVKPGMIVDTGNFFVGDREHVVFGLPASLQSHPNEQADFRAYGKIDNFYGLTIARMPPVRGILAYDRDRAVDLKAEAVASEPPAAIAAGPDTGPVEATMPAGE